MGCRGTRVRTYGRSTRVRTHEPTTCQPKPGRPSFNTTQARNAPLPLAFPLAATLAPFFVLRTPVVKADVGQRSAAAAFGGCCGIALLLGQAPALKRRGVGMAAQPQPLATWILDSNPDDRGHATVGAADARVGS